MSERIEDLIRDYPKMKQELEFMGNQIRNFKGLDDVDVIESMYFTIPEGEKVQTSGTSDKTARIAVTYREKMDRINREWYEHLLKEYDDLRDEILFFESALKALSGDLPAIMTDMIINGETWDSLCSIYHVSRTMIAKYRRKAIRELDELYAEQEKKEVAYMLS